MESAGGVSLYLKEPDLPAPGTLADVFSAVYPLSHEEAFHRARHCWGILAENISEEEAARLQDACRQAGLELLRLEADKAPRPPAPARARSLAMDGEGFTCQLDGDEKARCLWTELDIAAAAPVKEDIVRKETPVQGPSFARAASIITTIATGLPVSFGSKQPEQTRETVIREMNYVMDLCFAGRRLRLRSDDMDYSSLGPDKTYSSQGNFRALACRLEPLAAAALKNKGLKLIAARQPLQSLSYDSAADFERDFRRLFALFACARRG